MAGTEEAEGHGWAAKKLGEAAAFRPRPEEDEGGEGGWQTETRKGEGGQATETGGKDTKTDGQDCKALTRLSRTPGRSHSPCDLGHLSSVQSPRKNLTHKGLPLILMRPAAPRARRRASVVSPASDEEACLVLAFPGCCLPAACCMREPGVAPGVAALPAPASEAAFRPAAT